MPTLYASFPLARDAENAAGALIDQGAKAEDISILAHESYGSTRSTTVEHVKQPAITTTTGADALMGAAKGLSVGMGLGIIGAIAALTIPGVGIVIGAGAFYTAVAGAAATAVAGGAAGGVLGYLKDQGLSEGEIATYSRAIDTGGAVLSFNEPSGSLPENQAEGILLKYGASNVSTARPIEPSYSTPIETVVIPTNVQGEYSADTDVDTRTGLVETVNPVSNIEPTEIDPVTGHVVEGFILDPVSGVKRLVKVEEGKLIYMS